jgi:cofilin
VPNAPAANALPPVVQAPEVDAAPAPAPAPAPVAAAAAADPAASLFDLDAPTPGAAPAPPALPVASPGPGGGGSGGRSSSVVSLTSEKLVASDDAHEAFRALKLKRKHAFVLFKIDAGQVVVDARGGPQASLQDLFAVLPQADCRFIVYDHQFKTKDGRSTGKIWFLSWMPHNSNTHQQMAYSHGKKVARAVCDGVFDANARTPQDIEEAVGVAQDDSDGENSDFE